MFSNRAAFAALAVACVAAAGVGGYFSSRQNAVPTPAAAMAAPAPAASEALPQPGSSTGAAQAVDVAAASARSTETTASAPVSPSTRTKRLEAARPTEAASRATRPTPAAQVAANSDRPAAAVVASAPAAPAPAPVQSAPEPSASVRVDERTPEPVAPQGPPPKTYEELVVSASSVVGLQTESRISSETARVEDRVDAKVTRDVRVSDKVAIPAGSRVSGTVTLVERGGKFKERARIGIRFTTLLLPDGTRLAMSTETVFREGEDPGNGSAAKIGGGAIAGTILGAILGGSKGAAIGAAAGAGGGAVAVEASDRNAVTLPAGSSVTVRLLAPLTVLIEEK